ncbi:hypothetical protein LMH87_001479 [Akanthomyces muscarius]|uniref:Uncharacterized protein n=1 Tax=Akanthomyces muscarius TaxID=2231603 RepID=A0A9W8Q4W5_AKAMU|nr:hypothetical protein LMH87_001479 [Akanthomyces muscarius]KAJ4146924.1 hypothetical protein LMH87_001479 [Akanthomyces muscarius]
MEDQRIIPPITEHFNKKPYFRLLLQIDVPVLLNASPLQWLDHQTIHLAKQAVFLLLHFKESSDKAEKYREDASTFYNSAVEQLGRTGSLSLSQNVLEVIRLGRETWEWKQENNDEVELCKVLVEMKTAIHSIAKRHDIPVKTWNLSEEESCWELYVFIRGLSISGQ